MLSLSLLLSASVVYSTARLDERLRVIAEACVIYRTEPKDANMETFRYILYENRIALTSSFSETLDEAVRKEALLSVINDFDDELDKFAAQREQLFMKLARVMQSGYSPRLARAYSADLKLGSSPSADFYLIRIQGEEAELSWKLRIYDLRDISQVKFDIHLAWAREALLTGDGYSLEKEAAIASLSVWRPQLADRSEMLAFLDDVICDHVDVFFEQRMFLELQLDSPGETFSYRLFSESEKETEQKLVALYEDPDVGRLVQSLSGRIFYDAAKSTLDPLTQALFQKFREKRVPVDLDIVEKLLNRPDPGAPLDSDPILAMHALKHFMITPALVRAWLDDVKEFELTPRLRNDAEIFRAELEDGDRLRADQKLIHSVSDLQDKLDSLADSPIALNSREGEYNLMVEGMLGNVAVWMTSVVKLSTKEISDRDALLVRMREVVRKYGPSFAAQSIELGVDVFDFRYKKDKVLEDQLRSFDKSNKSIAHLRDLYLTIDEADAVRRVSNYLLVLEGLKTAKVDTTVDVLRVVESVLLGRSRG